MRQFFWLLQDDLSLAVAEVLALAKPTQALQLGHLLIIDAKETDFHKRIAWSHATYEFLFSCSATELYTAMAGFDWQKHYKSSFKLVVHDVQMDIPKLAGFIWRSLKNPKVDLDKPKTRFEIFFVGNRVVVGKRIVKIDAKPFLARRPHLRKANHPSGMQPRLARALVNLVGATKGTIVDPFCGAGGFLIEAGLMGFKMVGTDIDPAMIYRAKKNLAQLKLKASLKVADATKMKTKSDYFVTDLPYGLNTKGKALPKLYLAFLKRLKLCMKKRAIVVFPDFIDYPALLKKAKLKTVEEFSQRVHASLTRKIVVLEK
ncbi:MAG: methyltransferase domain-containing protein [Nanoarchaeota archaeon]